ncbi:fungal-specific transcription factor domain-containing protein [Boletus edulis]|nr:fungal-specific transcription factor domain-containing protein [Boletus edulis]
MEPNFFADPSKKRRKGATRLSCAECRRLKLRCDRNVPCGSCVKRGCGAICPDGSLTTGQGNRFVLASTQELHEKISVLCNRVRELEDSLRHSHSLLLYKENHLATVTAPRGGVKEEEQNGEFVDAFGSLSINASGGAKYYGSIANSWYFLQNEASDAQESEESRLASLQNVLSPEILARSGAFPLVPNSLPLEVESVRLRELFWYLPESHKAHYLCRVYFTFGAWMYNPITEHDFFDEIYALFYSPDVGSPSDDPLISHKLALIFMILAIGSLVDIKYAAYNIEAEKYHQLARAALFQSSLFEDPTISAVQALARTIFCVARFLMTFYLFLSDRHGSNSGTRWAIIGIAVKIAQCIGLHRDPSRWGVDQKETLRRRELFWELYTYDSWQCWTFGRPPTFYLSHIDCKLPYSDPADESFHAWKHRFTSECMSVVHDQAFGAKTPTYATVLQLDRKLRAFPVPPNLQVAGFGNSSPSESRQESVTLILQRHIVLALREMNLLYLHRSFFARAVTDHPKDPLGSPYGTSVIAAYRSAGSLVALMRNLHTQLKELSERLWFLWTHMFSCAIVLGSVVTRCPSMSLAPSALVQLDSACELLSKAARGFRAQPVLDVMITLQKKAHLSLNEFRRGKISPLSRQLSNHSEPGSPFEEDDELSTLGGKTRLVAKKDSLSPQSSPAVIDRSPTSLNPVVPLPLATGANQVHPTVVDYLKTFGHSAGSHTNVPSYAEASAYSTPIREHYEPCGYNDSPAQIQPMELVPGQFPNYFPVYDYAMVSENGYPQMNGHASASRRESPEANTMQNTWQDFVTSSGLSLGRNG